MKIKDAISAIDCGDKVDDVRSKFVDDYLANINYAGIQYENVRRKVEPKFTRLLGELYFAYHVFWKRGKKYRFGDKDMYSFMEYTELCGNIESQMQLAWYDENEKIRKYPALKAEFESEELGVSKLSILQGKQGMEGLTP